MDNWCGNLSATSSSEGLEISILLASDLDKPSQDTALKQTWLKDTRVLKDFPFKLYSNLPFLRWRSDPLQSIRIFGCFSGSQLDESSVVGRNWTVPSLSSSRRLGTLGTLKKVKGFSHGGGDDLGKVASFLGMGKSGWRPQNYWIFKHLTTVGVLVYTTKTDVRDLESFIFSPKGSCIREVGKQKSWP